MDFSIEKRRHRAEEQYEKDDIDLAYSFAKRCHEECRDLVKAIVLFGSTARKKQGANDVDVLVVIDDVSLRLTPELIQTYRVISGKLIRDISRRLHVTTLKFSAFWEYVRCGDPVAINILRDGYPLLDTGFFDPLQLLLHQGRIRPSPESVWTYLSRASQTLNNTDWHVLQAVVDLYWSVVDAAHAALMSVNEVPPSPEHVADLLQDKMVKKRLLPSWVPGSMRKFYTLSKDVLHRKRKSMKGSEFDKLVAEAEKFVTTLRKFVEKQ
ncbi:nucleotidyltransferase domain-containing protein [Candidatus Woesearchaeota archaeon]|nr:nucleotidyltransferase domain-containing protein [Candidatus Woesearchaeota archaeon]